MGYGLATLAYVPLPGLAWILARAQPRSRFMRFHSWQGGILTVLWLGSLLLLGFLSLVSQASGFQSAVGLLGGAVTIGWLVLAIRGAIGAATAHYKRVPVAYQIAARFTR